MLGLCLVISERLCSPKYVLFTYEEVSRIIFYFQSAFVSFCENSVVPRPPGSLERAKAIAAMKFPGDKIIDDFYDLPTEYSVRFESNVLVGFMFKVHPYFMRHGVYLKVILGFILPLL